MRQLAFLDLIPDSGTSSSDQRGDRSDIIGDDASCNIDTDALTPRRREVLALYLRGHTRKEIARYLGVSPNTVRNHIRLIYEQFGFRNRVEALRWALEQPPLAYQLLHHWSGDDSRLKVREQRANRGARSIEGLIAEAILFYQQSIIESPQEWA